MVVGEFVQERQLIVIGGGPGGYHAAIRAAQLGIDVTLIEKNQLGGICLNEGCIPSKVVTQAAERWQQTLKGSKLGIPTQQESFQWDVLVSHQQTVVKQLRQGVEQLCKANKIEHVIGEASFMTENRIGVTNDHQFDVYQFQHAIIATGHQPLLTEKDERLLSPYSLFQLKELPASLVLVGHKPYVLEAAFAYQTVGVDVTLLLDNPLSLEPAIEKELLRSAKKAGITVKKEITVEQVTVEEDHVTIVFMKNERQEDIQATYAYCSPKWKANTDELSLNRVGVETDGDGYITVSESFETTLANVYAIGDVNREADSATAAIKQGKVVAEWLAGKKSEWDPTFLATVYRTQPPIATVGWTVSEAKAKGVNAVVGSAPVRSNGFGMLNQSQDGVMVIVKEERTDEVIGMQIIADGAAELIVAATVGLELGMRDEDLIFPMYPHPSIGEVMMEAAEDLQAAAVHKPPVKKKAENV